MKIIYSDRPKINPTPNKEIHRIHLNDRSSHVMTTKLTAEEALDHCSSRESSSSTCTGGYEAIYTKENGPWFDVVKEISAVI